jgi:hypothetical protein
VVFYFSASKLNTLHLSFRFDGDAANLMTKHGWFERPPQAIDREYLAKESLWTVFFVTIGVIYSSRLKIFGMLFKPVFLSMLFMVPGVLTDF